jgi:GNAT superfamily N-acetyltransferase
LSGQITNDQKCGGGCPTKRFTFQPKGSKGQRVKEEKVKLKFFFDPLTLWVETAFFNRTMNSEPKYELRAPGSTEEWEAYHGIRRKVLFENRGRIGVYDKNHPDETHEGNYPLILLLEGEAIGVIRVDINGEQAIFRRVAIHEDLQRAGHGRMLLALAESFARAKRCNRIWSDVAPDAVGFYERCGYTLVPSAPMIGTSIPMQKNLA